VVSAAPHLREDMLVVRSVFADALVVGFRPALRNGRLALALTSAGRPALYLQGWHLNGEVEDLSPIALALPPLHELPLAELAEAWRAGEAQRWGPDQQTLRIVAADGTAWRFSMWRGEVVNGYRIDADATKDPDLHAAVAAMRSVVRVETPQSRATGVVVTDEIVATAAHVVRGVPIEDLQVDGLPVGAVVRPDEDVDLVFLVVPGLTRRPAGLLFGRVEKGRELLLVGYPSGEWTAVLGRVRSTSGSTIEVEAALAGGSSGGPAFVEEEARVAGIVLSGGGRSETLLPAHEIAKHLRDARWRIAALPAWIELHSALSGSDRSVPISALQTHFAPRMSLTRWYLEQLVTAAPGLQVVGPDVRGPPSAAATGESAGTDPTDHVTTDPVAE
jgi:hypothetical protein